LEHWKKGLTDFPMFEFRGVAVKAKPENGDVDVSRRGAQAAAGPSK